jgi:hypothetical protein
MSTTQSPFDPISLEIMWSRLTNIAEECWITLWRTAFSMIIGDAQDFGCELLDARGESLAHAHRSMPVFNLTLPQAVRLLLDYFPPETLKEGDPQRQDCRPDRLDRPLFRHRRHAQLAPGARGLRRRSADPAYEALPRRRAERGSLPHHSQECA